MVCKAPHMGSQSGRARRARKFRNNSDVHITKIMEISLTLLSRWLASWFLFALFLRWYFIFITVIK